MTTTLDLPDRVDPAAVRDAAQQTAVNLRTSDAVEVQLEPGDSTSYRLVIARPTSTALASASTRPYRTVQPGEMLVTLLTPSVGAAAWTPGGWTSPDYVTEHWDCGEWTARVVAGFLNVLAGELADTVRDVEADAAAEGRAHREQWAEVL